MRFYSILFAILFSCFTFSVNADYGTAQSNYPLVSHQKFLTGVYTYTAHFISASKSYNTNLEEFTDEHVSFLKSKNVNAIFLGGVTENNFRPFFEVLKKHNLPFIVELESAYFNPLWNDMEMAKNAAKAASFIKRYQDENNIIAFSIEEEIKPQDEKQPWKNEVLIKNPNQAAKVLTKNSNKPKITNAMNFSEPVVMKNQERGNINMSDLARLKALRPLPKYHYSSGLNAGREDFLTVTKRDLRYEYARITHALSIQYEWGHNYVTEVNECIYTANQLSGTTPKMKIGLICQPGYFVGKETGLRYGKGGNDPYRDPPDIRLVLPMAGKTIEEAQADWQNRYNAEFAAFDTWLSKMMALITSSGSLLEVGLVWMDQEFFRENEKDASFFSKNADLYSSLAGNFEESGEGLWEAMAQAYRTGMNTFHASLYSSIANRVLSYFPNADVTYFAMGVYYIPANGNYYAESAWHTQYTPFGKYVDASTSYDSYLYTVWEPAIMEQIVRRTIAHAERHSIPKTSYTIQLGGGYVWPKHDGGEFRYTYNYDYNIKYDYQMGALLNSTVSPFDKVSFIVFHPNPFWKDHPTNFIDHFEAYCQGATSSTP